LVGGAPHDHRVAVGKLDRDGLLADVHGDGLVLVLPAETNSLAQAGYVDASSKSGGFKDSAETRLGRTLGLGELAP
jgi:hypothetical protein